jgi:hypothetical protein
MPLDIALSTNTPTATIELRQAQALGDGRHLAAFLLVRSGAFAAALPFVFARDELVSFAEALAALCTTRSGVAQLHGRENEDVIRFESAWMGELRIAGHLHEGSEAQQLTFDFAAAWDGLESFIDGLRRLQAGIAD